MNSNHGKRSNEPVSAMADFGPSRAHTVEQPLAPAALDLSLSGPPVQRKGRTRRSGLTTVWSPASALGSLPSVALSSARARRHYHRPTVRTKRNWRS
jgi:hypothetical protein